MKYIVILLIFLSCTKSKEYIQRPTCYRYEQVTEWFDGEIRSIGKDTSYPNGPLSSIVCNDDTLKITNFRGDTVGCLTGGYICINYILIKTKKP